MEYYSGIKKHELMPFAANMDAPRDDHISEKSERERQLPSDTTYRWNLNYDTN